MHPVNQGLNSHGMNLARQPGGTGYHSLRNSNESAQNIEPSNATQLKDAYPEKSERNPGRANLQVSETFQRRVMQVLKAQFGDTHNLHANKLKAYHLNSNNSPESIASGILSVAMKIAQQTSHNSDSVISRVRQTIAKISDEIQNQNVRQSEVNTLKNLNTVINKQLDTIANIAPDKILNSALQASSHSTQSNLDQSTSISIRTREGDLIQLDLRQIENQNISGLSAINNFSSFDHHEFSFSSSSAIKLNVQGHLNEAELEAITEIFSEAEKLANTFFSGDLKAAMEIAANIQLDGEQLSQVDMDFNKSQTIISQQEVFQSSRDLPGRNEVPTIARSPVVEQNTLPQKDYLSQINEFLSPPSPSDDSTIAAKPLVANGEIRFEIDKQLRLHILQALMQHFGTQTLNAPDQASQITEFIPNTAQTKENDPLA